MDLVVNPEEFIFFKEALKEICESRRAVAWSYTIGYFLTNLAKK